MSREASQGDLELLSFPPLSTQFLKWGCHSEMCHCIWLQHQYFGSETVYMLSYRQASLLERNKEGDNWEKPSWIITNHKLWSRKVSLQRSPDLNRSIYGTIYTLGDFWNNRTISWQLVEFNNWKWSVEETKGTLPKPIMSLGILGPCLLKKIIAWSIGGLDITKVI